ncbi:arylsulfatase [Periconia macrospinosa]|uniref:Arylsulfatase n=1 Tax=Periconia macrospinosa TaxID=97972 RepID=A0A2V1E566_9PLEO|nr:arylsulfatase [Periconia macrospinosa]
MKQAISVLAALALAQGIIGEKDQQKPNIIFIMSDDQDRQLGSLDYMPVLQKELVAKGVEFENHFGTVSNCCPSRASFLRGQAAHSTNITHVRPPGGNYDKWRIAKEDLNYLPHWIKKAGYQAEYIGKFMNGYSQVNYHIPPKGWDHVDALLEPYINDYNNVVMSQNGERPVQYRGFHSTDVVRIKALDRLDRLIDAGESYFLAIMPYAPHVGGQNPPTPQARHADMFTDIHAPRFANWNPPDEIQQGKSVFLKDMVRMDSEKEAAADALFRGRIQSLQGIDEIIEDVLAKLEDKGGLENTYIIFTSDNGYHIGAHRLPGGKALPYIQDTNLPLVVRGPGMPQGVKSKVASAHLDFAPTFLDIMGLPQTEWPELLDGRSLLADWADPVPMANVEIGSAKEIINIEFWGDKIIEVPQWDRVPLTNNSYKTLRIVSEESSWMYVTWCTNEIELYNTTADPWEINNLARKTITMPHQNLINRLNALLMVTKSCTKSVCRDPWSALQPPSAVKRIASLTDAMAPDYDDFYANIPKVHFERCMMYQDEANEMPFYPEGAELDLGKAYRADTDNWVSSQPGNATVEGNSVPAGSVEQRHASLDDLMRDVHVLTDEETLVSVPQV